MKEQLKEAGLTENESKIYLTLLENGPSNAGLISRKSGLHRRVIYDTIERLIQKGLIGYIKKNNIRLFQASNPSRLKELLKEKEARIEEIMSSMQSLYTKTKEKEETNFYKGKNGLKSVFEDMLIDNKEILVLGASLEAYEILQFYIEWFDKRRQQLGVKEKLIFNTDKEVKLQKAEVKYLPPEYHSPLAVNIYKNKVAIILWSKKNPFAIVIKNNEISEGYKKYFKILWQTALPKPINKV